MVLQTIRITGVQDGVSVLIFQNSSLLELIYFWRVFFFLTKVQDTIIKYSYSLLLSYELPAVPVLAGFCNLTQSSGKRDPQLRKFPLGLACGNVLVND